MRSLRNTCHADQTQRAFIQVKWCDFQKILRVRAVEDTDVAGGILNAETGRAASQAMAGQTDAAKFLVGRAKLIEEKIGGHAPVAFEVPSWLKWCVWGAAFILGWCLAALGQEREINLLALPLIAILVWNALIMSLSLFHGMRHMNGNVPSPLMEKLMMRVVGRRDANENQPAALRFRELAWPVMTRRMSFRLRTWLHLGAALLAIGGVSGMFARGWSREYRAVWESTLLDENSTRVFFNALFAPASRITGIAIPLDQLPGMRRRSEVAAVKSGDALPWIKLYAVTLGLFVILPRVMLAGLERIRAGRVVSMTLRSADWKSYVGNLRASIEGNGAPACVLVHGLVIDDAARDRWRRQAHSQWRDVGSIESHGIPVGGEAEFVASWKPLSSRQMLVFNLSVTPEAEVQRALVESLLAKTSGSLLLALDDTEMKKRSAGFSDAAQRLTVRMDLWKRMMEGLPVTWT